MNYHGLCFVDMPFGQKSDLKSGVIVAFDQIYNNAIKPAIKQCGLEPLRGDEESTGGIIHSAMFARLLLSEFVVADLTLANAKDLERNCLDGSSGYLTICNCVKFVSDTNPRTFSRLIPWNRSPEMRQVRRAAAKKVPIEHFANFFLT